MFLQEIVNFSEVVFSLYCIRTYIFHIYLYIYIINVNLYTTIFYCNMLENTQCSKNIALKTFTKWWLIHFFHLFCSFVLATENRKKKVMKLQLLIERREEERSTGCDMLGWCGSFLKARHEGRAWWQWINTGVWDHDYLFPTWWQQSVSGYSKWVLNLLP